MSLSRDNAAFNFDFALGADELAGAAALNVAALANGSSNADAARVRERKLNLSCGADGAED